MTSVTFTPTGSQLDSDAMPTASFAIADLSLNQGDRFTASFTLDTSDLDSDLQSLTLQVDQDFGEAEFSVIRTNFDTTTFPRFELVSLSAEDNFTTAIVSLREMPTLLALLTSILKKIRFSYLVFPSNTL